MPQTAVLRTPDFFLIEYFLSLIFFYKPTEFGLFPLAIYFLNPAPPVTTDLFPPLVGVAIGQSFLQSPVPLTLG